MPDQSVVHGDLLLRQGAGKRLGQIVLEFLPAFTHDEVAGTVFGAFVSRNRRNLRHDQLLHDSREIAVTAEDPGDIRRRKFYLHCHVQADLEPVTRRELDAFRQHHHGIRHVCGKLRLQEHFLHPLLLFECVRCFALIPCLLRLHLSSGSRQSIALLQVVRTLLTLLLQHRALKLLHGCICGAKLAFRDNCPARLAEQRDLVHPDLQNIDFILFRIDVVEPGLQNVLANSFFVRAGEVGSFVVLPRKGSDHAGIADRNKESVRDLYLIAVRIKAVFPGSQNLFAHALLSRLGQELARGQILAYLR